MLDTSDIGENAVDTHKHDEGQECNDPYGDTEGTCRLTTVDAVLLVQVALGGDAAEHDDGEQLIGCRVLGSVELGSVCMQS